MTIKTIRRAAQRLDRPPIIMAVVVCIFLLAGLIAAAGRYTPARLADLPPIILVQTATAQPQPTLQPVVVIQVQYIVATPTAAPEPAAAAPQVEAAPETAPEVLVVNAPPATAPTMPAPEPQLQTLTLPEGEAPLSDALMREAMDR